MRSLLVCRCIAIALLLGYSSMLRADIIHLTNGDKIKGKIVSQKGSRVVIKTPFAILTYSKHKIAKIVIEPRPEERINVYLKDGSIYRGVVLEQTIEYIKILRDNGERKIFLKENVDRLDWKKSVKEKIVFPMKKKNPQKEKKDQRKIKKNKKSEKKSDENFFKDPFAGMTTSQLRWGSVWRSALLPSWGQFYKGYNTKGWIFASAMGVSLLGMLFSYLDYRDQKDKWESGDKTTERYDSMQRSSDIYFIFSISAFSVWLLNVLDAAIFSPELPVAKDAKFSLMPDSRTGAFCLQFEKRF